MGIIGTSLYNAFGDKRSLYRQVLAHYLETSVRDRVSRLERLPPLPAIRAFFEEVVQRSVTDEQRRGCMLVNAALELAPYDAEFEEIVSQEMMFIEISSGDASPPDRRTARSRPLLRRPNWPKYS